MEISEITVVIETNRVEEASEFLELGWKLLGVANGANDEGSPQFLYSLGYAETEDDGAAYPERLR